MKLDSNQRRPEGHLVYSQVQLPLCDSCLVPVGRDKQCCPAGSAISVRRFTVNLYPIIWWPNPGSNGGLNFFRIALVLLSYQAMISSYCPVPLILSLSHCAGFATTALAVTPPLPMLDRGSDPSLPRPAPPAMLVHHTIANASTWRGYKVTISASRFWRSASALRLPTQLSLPTLFPDPHCGRCEHTWPWRPRGSGLGARWS